MTQDLISAGWDHLLVVLFWGPGLLTALLLGAKKISHVLPLGFIFSATYLSAVYTTLVLVHTPETFWVVSRIVFAVGFVVLGAVAVIKRPPDIISNGLVMAGITAIAVIARNIFRLDARPLFSDQWVIGWISSYIQSGADPTALGTVDYIKRSLIFPLILTTGRDGTIAISLVTITAILMVMATYHLVRVLCPNSQGSVRFGVFAAVMMLWITSSFFWGMFAYQNAHVLVALSVAVLVSHVFADRMATESFWLGPAGTFAAGFVIAQSRIETAGLALLLTVPILIFADKRPPAESRARLAALLGPPLGFYLWLVTTDAFVFQAIPAVAVAGIFLPVVVLILWPQLSGFIGRLLIPLVLGLLIGLTFWFFVIADGGASRRSQFFKNIFLAEGMWGFGVWAFLAIALIGSLWKMSQKDALLLWGTIVALLFTIDVKIVDGLFVFGGIPGFGRGWTDSTNRASFHLFAPMTAVMVTSIIRSINKDSVMWLGQRRGSTRDRASLSFTT